MTHNEAMPLRVLLALALLAAFLPAQAPRWRQLNAEARSAIDAKDYSKLRSVLLELQPLLPGNPRILYNLAASEARLGHRDAALASLRNLAATGLIYDLAPDDDFASLRPSPEYAALVARFERNKTPVAHATSLTTITGPDLIPEDIAWDPKTRRFLLSSVSEARILRPDGQTFATAAWSVFALRPDPARHLLWATIGYVPHCARCDKADDGKTALLAFDLTTGALRQRIASPVSGLLGDMTISRHGDLYVSEGLHGAVLRLPRGAATLERLDEPGEFPSPQTPALSADEKTLYIPDYIRGIAALDLTAVNVSTRKARWLQPAAGIALSGIDGLYVHHNSFLAVQNGTNPARVVRFSLDLQKQEILEAGTPGLGEPTHGVLIKNDFFFIANSGWGDYDDKGAKKPGSAPVVSAIRRLKLR